MPESRFALGPQKQKAARSEPEPPTNGLLRAPLGGVQACKCQNRSTSVSSEMRGSQLGRADRIYIDFIDPVVVAQESVVQEEKGCGEQAEADQ